MRSQKIQQRAAKLGFDWQNVRQVMDKVAEELAEVSQAVAADDADAVAEEIGDLIFAVVNLARFTRNDAESLARAANDKFLRRFAYIERGLAAQNRTVSGTALEELEALWQESKSTEK